MTYQILLGLLCRIIWATAIFQLSVRHSVHFDWILLPILSNKRQQQSCNVTTFWGGQSWQDKWRPPSKHRGRWDRLWLIPHSLSVQSAHYWGKSGHSPTWLRARLLGGLLLLELGHYAKHAAATVPLAVTQRVVLVHKHSQPIAFHLATQLSRYLEPCYTQVIQYMCADSSYGGQKHNRMSVMLSSLLEILHTMLCVHVCVCVCWGCLPPHHWAAVCGTARGSLPVCPVPTPHSAEPRTAAPPLVGPVAARGKTQAEINYRQHTARRTMKICSDKPELLSYIAIVWLKH